MQMRRYQTHQFDELVALIARLNSQPAHHIGYFGTQLTDIRTTLQAITPPLEEGFVLAYDNQRLAGVLGVEYDTILGRAWLFGPLLDHAAAAPVADELYTAVR
jgi:hypothetical protein